jgi:dihydropteroate synthase
MTTHKTLLMGVLNVTPDSFSDGGKYFQNAKKAVSKIKQMLSEGADIIDIGGESTYPGTQVITVEEEISRVVSIIQAARRELGNKFLISVDTYKGLVAKKALESGANIINSLGGFRFDPQLIETIKKSKCPIIIYDIKDNPKVGIKNATPYQDVIKEVESFFTNQINLGLKNGLKKTQFILDPGIGFGKTLEQNLEIINNLKEFAKFGLPILVGISRKDHLGKILQQELSLKEVPKPSERLEAALAETAICILNGADIIRTHDVLETKKFISVIDRIKIPPRG